MWMRDARPDCDQLDIRRRNHHRHHRGLVGSYAYDPYGITRAATGGNHIRYTGAYLDHS
jgi:hypothetical protein